MFKKVLLVAVAVILTVGYAQAQFKFGARAGLNLTNMKMSVGGISVEGSMKPGFQIGVVGEYSIAESFAIQPGLLFAQQGLKMDSDGETAKIMLNYLQIPINAMYKVEIGGDAKLLLQAGPYLGYAIGGKYKYDDESVDIDFGSSKEDDFKPFDFGLGIGAGVQFSSFQVGVGYNFGLMNIDSEGSSDYKAKNNGLVFTLTYLFGK